MFTPSFRVSPRHRDFTTMNHRKVVEQAGPFFDQEIATPPPGHCRCCSGPYGTEAHQYSPFLTRFRIAPLIGWRASAMQADPARRLHRASMRTADKRRTRKCRVPVRQATFQMQKQFPLPIAKPTSRRSRSWPQSDISYTAPRLLPTAMRLRRGHSVAAMESP